MQHSYPFPAILHCWAKHPARLPSCHYSWGCWGSLGTVVLQLWHENSDEHDINKEDVSLQSRVLFKGTVPISKHVNQGGLTHPNHSIFTLYCDAAFDGITHKHLQESGSLLRIEMTEGKTEGEGSSETRPAQSTLIDKWASEIVWQSKIFSIANVGPDDQILTKPKGKSGPQLCQPEEQHKGATTNPALVSQPLLSPLSGYHSMHQQTMCKVHFGAREAEASANSVMGMYEDPSLVPKRVKSVSC